MITKKEARQKLFNNGPNRVLTSHEGDATTLKRAIEMGLKPDIVFIRKDGWMLGAPYYLETAAYKIWKDEWLYFLRRPDTYLLDIDHYRGPY